MTAIPSSNGGATATNKSSQYSQPSVVSAKRRRLEQLSIAAGGGAGSDSQSQTSSSSPDSAGLLHQDKAASLARRRTELLEERRALPISEHQEKLVRVVHERAVVILVSATGSGKTTQLAQFLLAANLTRGRRDLALAITQPRRVAAISVATRVAEEMGVVLGEEVGYRVRFEECYRPGSTRLLYQTDGMLLREAAADPLLKRYAAVLLDEAHERTLATDLLLAVAKAALRRRAKSGLPPLKIVVMSATLDPAPYQKFFGGAPECQVVWLEGARHDLHLAALPSAAQDYVTAAQLAVLQLHQSRPLHEHMLVFLTGEEEIVESVAALKAAGAALNGKQQESNLLVLPLYAALSAQAQRRALAPAPPGKRKVLLATNIAESSLTIAGVRLVVDCGRAKVKEIGAGGLEELRVRWISQAAAWQRAGRANRQGAGRCYRLYTQEQYEKMRAAPTPELLRCQLAGAAVHMLAMGYEPRRLPLLDAPQPERLEEAMTLLRDLGALEGEAALSALGRQLARLPLEPRVGRVVLAAAQLGCLKDALKVVALLSVDELLMAKGHAQVSVAKRERALDAQRRFHSALGDVHTSLNVFNAFLAVKGNTERRRWMQEHCIDQRSLLRALCVHRQLRQLCERSGFKEIAAGASKDSAKKTKNLDGDGEDATSAEEATAGAGSSPAERSEKLVRALCHGFFTQTALLQRNQNQRSSGATGATYVCRKPLVGVAGGAGGAPAASSKLMIHPSSVLFNTQPTSLLFIECVRTNHCYMRRLCVVPADLPREVAPQYFNRLES